MNMDTGGKTEVVVMMMMAAASVDKRPAAKKDIRRVFRKVSLDDEDVFEVEKIVGLAKVDGRTLYRVRWAGYTAQCDTWEPYDNLLTCKDLVDEYLQREQRKKRKTLAASSGGHRPHKKKATIPLSKKVNVCGVSCPLGGQDATVASSVLPSEGKRFPAAATSDGTPEAIVPTCGRLAKGTGARGFTSAERKKHTSGHCVVKPRAHAAAGRPFCFNFPISMLLQSPTGSQQADQKLPMKAASRSTDCPPIGGDTDLIGEPRVARSNLATSVPWHTSVSHRHSPPVCPSSRTLPFPFSVAGQRCNGCSSDRMESVAVGVNASTAPPVHGRCASRPTCVSADSGYETGLSSDSSNDTTNVATSVAPPASCSTSQPQKIPLKSEPRPLKGGFCPVQKSGDSPHDVRSVQYVCIDGVPVVAVDPQNTLCRSESQAFTCPLLRPLTNEELKQAVKKGDYATVTLALRNSRSDIEQKNARGTTLLMMACMAGYEDVAELLILHGANPNAQHWNGSTPLMLACDRGRLNTVAVLLLAGAHTELYDNAGETALVKACHRGYHDIAQMLLKNGANFAKVRLGDYTLSPEVEQCVNSHIARVTAKFSTEVEDTLKRTAKILHAVFPMHCFPLGEGTSFEVLFDHQLTGAVEGPGVGMLLFIAHARISSEGIRCRLFGDCAVQSVTLNGIKQPSLTENTNFVLSFRPVINGRNKLNIQTNCCPNSELKLLVCAYKAQLLSSSEKC